jgi:hypothetical protein
LAINMSKVVFAGKALNLNAVISVAPLPLTVAHGVSLPDPDVGTGLMHTILFRAVVVPVE